MLTAQNQAQSDAQLILSPRERGALAAALNRDFEAFLAPGERFAVHAEQGAAYLYAQLLLTSADQRFKLDLEASLVAQDFDPAQDAAMPRGRKGADLLLAFLRLELYEFFRSDRTLRFHVDWRLYELEGVTLRFRGGVTSPALQDQADALLGPDEDAE